MGELDGKTVAILVATEGWTLVEADVVRGRKLCEGRHEGQQPRARFEKSQQTA